MVSASCSTQGPPSPLCHCVIISSTPSLPLSSPFTEQAHNKTHSVTLCIFTPSLLALSETASPSQFVPLGAFFFFMWGGVGPVLWLSDLSCCQKEATARHCQGQQAVALEGAAAVSWLLQTSGSRSVCKTSRGKWFRFLHHLSCWSEDQPWVTEATSLGYSFVINMDSMASFYHGRATAQS